MKVRRKFTKEFKQAAVGRLNAGQSLHRWRRELQEHGERAFQGSGNKRAGESKIAELERKVGQQTLEIDF